LWRRLRHEALAEASVKADNRAAIRLYRRHGFAGAGRSPDDTDERRMRRSIRMNQMPGAR
jgi:ribosomal protein S18 acetylase RimI-like enzyme